MPATSREESSNPSLRLWPGIVLVALQWSIWLVLPKVVAGNAVGMIAALGGLVLGPAVVVWWAWLSRAPGLDRGLGALAMIAAPFAAAPWLHESIATAGMGMLYYVYVVPTACLAFLLWAVASRALSAGARRATMVATLLLACGAWTLLRMEGVSDAGSAFEWRWSATAEERLLAVEGADPTVSVSPLEVPESEAEWPGFRGPSRDGHATGASLDLDWSTSPPTELWRRPVGPGWSSFAVRGSHVYTQEQRGEDEVVACYSLVDGEPVWRHRDPVRFWEANAGAGPRATPTLHDGRVYAFGATGILNALDAGDGSRLWSRDVAIDAQVEVPYWGFSSSPLVVGDAIVVAASGRLIAYGPDGGDPIWLGPDDGTSYSSPHRVELDGVEQVVLLSQSGAIGVAPVDGALLWRHAWDGFPIVQPALTSDGDVLIGSDQIGTLRLAVALGEDGWTTEERWTSNRLKPYFNDFVVHAGYAFGFDGSRLAALDLNDGERVWKGGRHGHGQLLLLPEQELLIVLSEQGELVLVGATAERYDELARYPALDGKSWNHPVLIGDVLLVRNDREMVALRLPTAERRAAR